MSQFLRDDDNDDDDDGQRRRQGYINTSVFFSENCRAKNGMNKTTSI